MIPLVGAVEELHLVRDMIEIFLPPKKLRKKMMKIVTGSEALEDPKDPDGCNIINLFRLFATPEQVAHIRALGFNRVSMGVQDLDPRVQELVHRDQTTDETRAMCRLPSTREAAVNSGARAVPR